MKKKKNDRSQELAGNEVVSQVKLLLSSEDAEDTRIARALGRNHSISRAQEKVGFQIELEKLDKEYDGNVFKIEDIKDLCVKYNMRFLRSEHFAGHLDIVVIQKIKEFAKTTNTDISEATFEQTNN